MAMLLLYIAGERALRVTETSVFCLLDSILTDFDASQNIT